MKNKILSLIVGTMLAMSLVACGSASTPTEASNDTTTNVETSSDTTTETSTETEVVEDTAEFTPHDLYVDESLYPLFDDSTLIDSSYVSCGLLNYENESDCAYIESLLASNEYYEYDKEGYTNRTDKVNTFTTLNGDECNFSYGLYFNNVNGLKYHVAPKDDSLGNSGLAYSLGYIVPKDSVPAEFTGTYKELSDTLGNIGILTDMDKKTLEVFWTFDGEKKGKPAYGYVKATFDCDGNCIEYYVTPDSALTIK